MGSKPKFSRNCVAMRNCATSWSSGIQWRSLVIVGVLLRRGAAVRLVRELMSGLCHTHSWTEHHALGHEAGESSPHRHWQAKDWWKEDGQQRQAGSARFHPPEIKLWGPQPTRAAGLWAAGLCFHTFLAGKLPLTARWHSRWTEAAAFSCEVWTLLGGLLQVKDKELRGRPMRLCVASPLCRIVGRRRSFGSWSASCRPASAKLPTNAQLKPRHCWRLLGRSSSKAWPVELQGPQRFASRIPSHNKWHVQTNRLILFEKSFLHFWPLCFHWLRMIASTPPTQFHIHVDSNASPSDCNDGALFAWNQEKCFPLKSAPS